MRLKTFFYELSNYDKKNNKFEVGKTYTESDLNHEIIVTKYIKNIEPNKFSQILQVESTSITMNISRHVYYCNDFKVLKILSLEEIMDTAIYEGLTEYYFECRFPNNQYRSKAKATNAVINRPEIKYYMAFDDNLCFENGDKVIVGKEYPQNANAEITYFTCKFLDRLVNQHKNRVFELQPLDKVKKLPFGYMLNKILVIKELTTEEIKEILISEGVPKYRIETKLIDIK